MSLKDIKIMQKAKKVKAEIGVIDEVDCVDAQEAFVRKAKKVTGKRIFVDESKTEPDEIVSGLEEKVSELENQMRHVLDKLPQNQAEVVEDLLEKAREYPKNAVYSLEQIRENLNQMDDEYQRREKERTSKVKNQLEEFSNELGDLEEYLETMKTALEQRREKCEKIIEVWSGLKSIKERHRATKSRKTKDDVAPKREEQTSQKNDLLEDVTSKYEKHRGHLPAMSRRGGRTKGHFKNGDFEAFLSTTEGDRLPTSILKMRAFSLAKIKGLEYAIEDYAMLLYDEESFTEFIGLLKEENDPMGLLDNLRQKTKHKAKAWLATGDIHCWQGELEKYLLCYEFAMVEDDSLTLKFKGKRIRAIEYAALDVIARRCGLEKFEPVLVSSIYGGQGDKAFYIQEHESRKADLLKTIEDFKTNYDTSRFYTAKGVLRRAVKIDENSVVELHLEGIGLKEVPNEIKHFKNLEALNLTYNGTIKIGGLDKFVNLGSGHSFNLSLDFIPKDELGIYEHDIMDHATVRVRGRRTTFYPDGHVMEFF